MQKEQKILGVKVNMGITKETVLNTVEETYLKDGKAHYICTTNPEFIMDAQSDPEFKKIINNCDLSVPDGSGVVLASAFLDTVSKYNKESLLYPLQLILAGIETGLSGLMSPSTARSRIDGVGLVESLCQLSAQNNYSVFFLGGRPKDAWGRQSDTKIDLATAAAAEMRKRYPNVNIIGATSQFSRNPSDDMATISYIHECMKQNNLKRLDFVFVAYNHIYQEKWIVRNAKSIPASLSIGVGAAFDYLSGYKVPSPEIVTNKNLGWLFRLITQPWRYKRVLKAFPIFPLVVFFNELKRR